jgi:hypothetical protein
MDMTGGDGYEHEYTREDMADSMEMDTADGDEVSPYQLQMQKLRQRLERLEKVANTVISALQNLQNLMISLSLLFDHIFYSQIPELDHIILVQSSPITLLTSSKPTKYGRGVHSWIPTGDARQHFVLDSAKTVFKDEVLMTQSTMRLKIAEISLKTLKGLNETVKSG